MLGSKKIPFLSMPSSNWKVGIASFEQNGRGPRAAYRLENSPLDELSVQEQIDKGK